MKGGSKSQRKIKLIKWNENLAQLQQRNDLLNQKEIKRVKNHHEEELLKGIATDPKTYMLSYSENQALKE